MPYLRFSRDGRGYENTYVLHTVQEGGKVRPRMLYWSRTPPNVGVVRPPLDEDAIRALEENNPDLVFEWDKILAARAAAKADQSQGSPRPRGARRRGRQAPDKAGKRPQEKRRVAQSGDAGGPEASVRVEPPVVSDATDPLRVDSDEMGADPVSSAAVVQTPDVEEADTKGSGDRLSSRGDGQHPVVTLMGDDALARLRNRYAELQARIGELPPDVAERESIRARAATLDPDGWGGLEAALTGIERFKSDVAEVERRLELTLPPMGRPDS